MNDGTMEKQAIRGLIAKALGFGPKATGLTAPGRLARFGRKHPGMASAGRFAKGFGVPIGVGGYSYSQLPEEMSPFTRALVASGIGAASSPQAWMKGWRASNLAGMKPGATATRYAGRRGLDPKLIGSDPTGALFKTMIPPFGYKAGLAALGYAPEMLGGLTRTVGSSERAAGSAERGAGAFEDVAEQLRGLPESMQTTMKQIGSASEQLGQAGAAGEGMKQLAAEATKTRGAISEGLSAAAPYAKWGGIGIGGLLAAKLLLDYMKDRPVKRKKRAPAVAGGPTKRKRRRKVTIDPGDYKVILEQLGVDDPRELAKTLGKASSVEKRAVCIRRRYLVGF